MRIQPPPEDDPVEEFARWVEEQAKYCAEQRFPQRTDES